jgi:uncharacterized protein YjbI with pentapeptide repeats
MGASSIELPLFWVLVIGIVLASVLFSQLPLSRFTGQRPPLEAFQAKLGLPGLNAGLFFLILLLWGALFLLLSLGLVWLIYSTLTEGLPAGKDAEAEWRFALTKLVALTGVLGAVVALPFTLVRIGLTRQQVNTAKEALLNDKIDVAVSDLYAQRQITVKEGEAYHDIWEDDITRRNGAIDRLEGLVAEDKTLSPRVIRMLSVYVRELSRTGAKAQEVPEGLEVDALRDWAEALTVQRSDMEKAVQTLGRLPVFEDDQGRTTRPDLTGANLQAMDLSGLDFEKSQLRGARLQGANLTRAKLQGAYLSGAQLQGAYLLGAQLQGAKLSSAQLQWAYLLGAQLQGAKLSSAQLQEADLLGAQLQGAKLIGAQLQGADLLGAQLQGTNLSRAQFDPNTNLSAATFRGAALRSVDFTTLPQIADHLEHLFGDDTVKLPRGVTAPAHFSQSYEDYEAFITAWRAFQRSIGQDPNNPT